MEDDIEPGFTERVELLVRQIPRGRVMTYGQLAALCGSPRAARIVGGIAHFGDPELPWQRVVNKQGGLAAGYPGGRARHKAALEAEGLQVSEEHKVALAELLWWPSTPEPASTPLLVIVGETASGKSALALQLAQRYGGEIICADSRTVYRGMDIGTAKPSKAERAVVPHFGLDLVDPDEHFTVADYKAYTMRKIDEIAERGNLPIMVGGTGLYIDAVIYDYQFRTPTDPDMRAELESFRVDELQQRLYEQGILLPENARNPRHLIRAIETAGEPANRSELRPNTMVIGLQVSREDLRQRIAERVDTMVDNGFIDEVRSLSQKYGWEAEALQTPGYKAFRAYLEGTVSIDKAKLQFIQNDMNLAKRQRTWFKRNKSIHWLVTEDKLAEAVDIATTFLNK